MTFWQPEVRLAVSELLDSADLTTRMREVLLLRYVAGMPFSEIAIEWDRSRERVYGIHKEALTRVRRRLAHNECVEAFR